MDLAKKVHKCFYETREDEDASKKDTEMTDEQSKSEDKSSTDQTMEIDTLLGTDKEKMSKSQKRQE